MKSEYRNAIIRRVHQTHKAQGAAGWRGPWLGEALGESFLKAVTAPLDQEGRLAECTSMMFQGEGMRERRRENVAQRGIKANGKIANAPTVVPASETGLSSLYPWVSSRLNGYYWSTSWRTTVCEIVIILCFPGALFSCVESRVFLSSGCDISTRTSGKIICK